MITLYLHADTAGMWKWRLPSTDPLQPPMVRVAISYSDRAGAECVIVRPRDPFEIEPEAERANGVGLDAIREWGVSPDAAMARVGERVPEIGRVVAYGADFHRHALERTAEECGLVIPWHKGFWTCAMRRATPVCRVPRMQPGGGFAYPKLGAAYEILTGNKLERREHPIEQGEAVVLAVRAIDEAIEKLEAK